MGVAFAPGFAARRVFAGDGVLLVSRDRADSIGQWRGRPAGRRPPDFADALAACRRDLALLRKVQLELILAMKRQGRAPPMGGNWLGFGAVLFTPTNC